jgi:hypothetical protein
MFNRRHPVSQYPDKLEAADAQVAWAIHLHQQIHVYLRTVQFSFQVLGTAIIAALVATTQHPKIFPYILIALPYALGLTLQIQTLADRETQTCAGVVECLERDIHDRVGKWVLYQESAFSGYGTRSFGDKLGRMILAISTVGVAAVSIWTGFGYANLVSLNWAIANTIAIAALYAMLAASFIDAKKARPRVQLSIKNFVSSN